MEVVVTTGAKRCAKLQSNFHHQQTNTQLFIGRMPFLFHNQQRQNTERKNHIPRTCSLGGLPTPSLTNKCSWLPRRRLPSFSSALWRRKYLIPFALNINLFGTYYYVSLVSISSTTTRRVMTVIQLNLHCYLMGLDTCNITRLFLFVGDDAADKRWMSVHENSHQLRQLLLNKSHSLK